MRLNLSVEEPFPKRNQKMISQILGRIYITLRISYTKNETKYIKRFKHTNKDITELAYKNHGPCKEIF
jgi:hypothetical protein